MKCPECHVFYEDEDTIEQIQSTGMCFDCADKESEEEE